MDFLSIHEISKEIQQRQYGTGRRVRLKKRSEEYRKGYSSGYVCGYYSGRSRSLKADELGSIVRRLKLTIAEINSCCSQCQYKADRLKDEASCLKEHGCEAREVLAILKKIRDSEIEAYICAGPRH